MAWKVALGATRYRHWATVARRAGWAVESPDYSHTRDPRQRVAELLERRPHADKLVLAGSSMGGYVSAFAATSLQADGLFLMAPALLMPGYDEWPAPFDGYCQIVHGWKDDVIPAANAIRYAELQQTELILLNSGHTLTDQLPMLEFLFDRFLNQIAAASMAEPIASS